MTELTTKISDQDIALIDLRQLSDKLVREIGLPEEVATRISNEVDQILKQLGLPAVCPSLIRGLIDTKLLEYGYEVEYQQQRHLGLPLREVDRIIQQIDRPNYAHPLDVRATSLTLSNTLKRDYALVNIFSDLIANAHLEGEIDIEGIESVDAPYSLMLSPDYLKRIGPLLPPWVTITRPLRQAEDFIVALTHSTEMLARSLSGPVSWDSINFTLAPMLAHRSIKEIGIIATELIERFNGLGEKCQLHIDWSPPSYIAERRALAIDGSELETCYRDYMEPARYLFVALLERYLAGGQSGLPITNPKLIIHINNSDTKQVTTANSGETTIDIDFCLEILGKLARERGQFEVRFYKPKVDLFAERYGLPLTAAMQNNSWDWRASIFQVVAINLPRAALQVSGDSVRVFEKLTEILEKAAQAHLEQRIYLEKLLAQGKQGPLAVLARRRQSAALLKLNRSLHWISPIGLNEMTYLTLGHHLHENEEASEFGKQVSQYLAQEVKRLSAKHKVNFVLAQFDNAETAHRFARLDLRHFTESVTESFPELNYIQESGYTPALNLLATAKLSPTNRLTQESSLQMNLLHQSSTIWHIPSLPPLPEDCKQWLLMALKNGASLMVELHFALCLECHSTLRGRPESCTFCHSKMIRQYI